jgi:flagellar protein FliO/FliZ
VAATLGLAAVTLSGGALGPAAARAALAVAALGAAALWVRRSPARLAAGAALAVVARAPLGRDAGLAIVEADGRRLLVGHGDGGVRLVAELGPSTRGAP